MRSNLSQRQVESEMTALIRVLDQARRLGIQNAEALIRTRGIANVRELARIRARDGADAVNTLDQAATLLVGGARAAQIQSDLLANDFASSLKPEQTSVLGRVLDERGLPAAGYRLRVLTDNGAAVADTKVD